jgi:hypothetical protein
LIGLCLLAFAATTSASVTCKENVMTSNRFCSSTPERSGANFYFFATNDAGTEANVLFNFAGLISASRPDGVMVKLDDAAPFKVQASPTRADVNCRGSGGCRWSVGASAKFTPEHFAQCSASTKMLVSFTEGSYVSDPIEVNPKAIGGWFQEWRGLTQSAAPSAASSPANEGSP